MSPSLLVVDDEVNVARTLQLVFEAQGYRVRVAHSCAEALNILAARSRFDAVITDLNMERENIGLAVASAAQALKPRPVVVICTGYADTVNLGSALKLGIDYVALKPVDLPELIAALRRLLAMRQMAKKKSAAG